MLKHLVSYSLLSVLENLNLLTHQNKMISSRTLKWLCKRLSSSKKQPHGPDQLVMSDFYNYIQALFSLQQLFL